MDVWRRRQEVKRKLSVEKIFIQLKSVSFRSLRHRKINFRLKEFPYFRVFSSLLLYFSLHTYQRKAASKRKGWKNVELKNLENTQQYYCRWIRKQQLTQLEYQEAPSEHLADEDKMQKVTGNRERGNLRTLEKQQSRKESRARKKSYVNISGGMLAWCASRHRTESSIFIIDHSRSILDVCVNTAIQESLAVIAMLLKGKFITEMFFFLLVQSF